MFNSMVLCILGYTLITIAFKDSIMIVNFVKNFDDIVIILLCNSPLLIVAWPDLESHAAVGGSIGRNKERTAICRLV